MRFHPGCEPNRALSPQVLTDARLATGSFTAHRSRAAFLSPARRAPAVREGRGRIARITGTTMAAVRDAGPRSMGTPTWRRGRTM